MSLVSLGGLEELLPAIDTQADPDSVFAALRPPFEQFLNDFRPEIPEGKQSARRSPYARYLLSAPDLPIQVVLAVWEPGTASAIHDHQGLHGAVGLLRGRLSESKYALTSVGESYRVAQRLDAQMIAGKASAIHPWGLHQVHRMANHGSTTAMSIHVYLGRLERVNLYHPRPDGTLATEPRNLWFD